MANGDTFIIGAPPSHQNEATSATLLIHNGATFGTQHTAFWVQRFGLPVCSAAIRGDNFTTRVGGVVPAGVLGFTTSLGGIGVLGSVSGPIQRSSPVSPRVKNHQTAKHSARQTIPRKNDSHSGAGLRSWYQSASQVREVPGCFIV